MLEMLEIAISGILDLVLHDKQYTIGNPNISNIAILVTLWQVLHDGWGPLGRVRSPTPDHRLPDYRLPDYRLPDYRLPDYRGGQGQGHGLKRARAAIRRVPA